MAKIDVLDILRSKKKSPLEFNYDSLWIPPIHMYLTVDDIEKLRKIATSLRLSSKIQQKYKMIDEIMTNRGFKRFSAGTNRVVYSFLEDTRFVVKIAVDKVGMQDNPLEYKNQELLKPYCTKMFYISPCGTVGFAERVLPVKNKGEFKEIATDVFDILIHKILGKYVMEDVGTRYFMNYGIRPGYGPVLLDYPFLYKLDGSKLFCNKVDPYTTIPCNGEIDYDAGFNHLVCTKCGKIYLATDLRDDSTDNKIIIKGGNQMKIVLKKGDQIVGRPIPTSDVMERPKKKKKHSRLVIMLVGGPTSKPKVPVSDTGCEESNDDIAIRISNGSRVSMSHDPTERWINGTGEVVSSFNNLNEADSGTEPEAADESTDFENNRDIPKYTDDVADNAVSEDKTNQEIDLDPSINSEVSSYDEKDDTTAEEPPHDEEDDAVVEESPKPLATETILTSSIDEFGVKAANSEAEPDNLNDTGDGEETPDSKYDSYDDDETERFQRIHSRGGKKPKSRNSDDIDKGKRNVERDASGRFVSRKGGKPSKTIIE